MIAVRSASIAFGDRVLFSDLDLDVGRGQFVGLAGESGRGKTSLLRALLGFVPLTAGSVEICGLPLDVHHVAAIRRQVSYVPQELQPPAATGADLIRLTHGLEINVSLDGSNSLASIMKSLGLEASLLELSAAKLSGGQRQRLLLAAALALHKPLLLLDEPTSALDEESTQRVALALLRVCHEEGCAALAVSHNPSLLAFCDKVITIA
ncbi:MAG: ABC transporter ATP-binding protein [Bacteroidaceae bacterium]|nr:ABC transporter ATP-binding protein [Bacteroidaceae bacterium]